jgi:hypothetical protein
MRRAVAVSVVTVLGLLAAGCSGGDGGGRSSARLTVDGQADVAAAGGPYRPAGATRTLHAADRVRVGSGTAVLRLGGSGQVELRGGSEVELRPPVGTGDLRPSVLGGRVLVTAGSGPARAVAGRAEMSFAGGSARVDSGGVVAVYTGTGSVSSAGRPLAVPALRQASVGPSGQLPAAPAPLAYDEKDPWDQRFLGDAIDLGNQLVARSNGFTAQLGPGEGHSTGFYRSILPALEREPAFDESSLSPSRPPGENLVGLAVAVQGTRGTFPDRVRSIFGFRDEGAAWGLVALDQKVSRAPVLASVDQAIAKGPPSAAERPPPATSPPTTARTRTPRTTPNGSRSAPSGGTPAAVPSASGQPASPPPAETGVPLVNDTVNALVDLLSGLLGGLGGR